MSKQIDENINKLADEFAEKLANLLIGVLESALASNGAPTPTPEPEPTPEPTPEPKAKKAATKKPIPQEAEPVEVKPEPGSIDDFFSEPGGDEEPAEKLSFAEVSKTFFVTFRQIGDLVGPDKSADITRNLLRKYTGGKPLSRNTLAESDYASFLETVEGLLARAKEISSKGGKNG